MFKQKNILIAFIVLLLLILIGGAIGTYFYIKKDNVQKVDVQKVVDIKTPTINELEDGKDIKKLSSMGPLYSLDPFVVNLMGKDGEVYLSVKLDFELSNKGLKKELDAKTAVIRDAIIRILTSKTLSELSTDAGKEKTADEIADDLNQMLQNGYIEDVYFTKFITQQ